MKKEMEEQRLKELYKPLVEKAREKLTADFDFETYCKGNSPVRHLLLKTLIESEPLLYVRYGLQISSLLFITHRGVYKVVRVFLPSCNGTEHKTAPIYTFHNPLDGFGISLLKQLDKGDIDPYSEDGNGSILSRIGASTLDARRKFESVIRLIPGEYRNGSWRQLDGFFGVYYNPDTNTIQEEPPV